MQKIIRILAVTAAIQIALVAAAYIGGSDLESTSVSSAMLTFQPQDVDRIVIAGASGAEQITLEKEDGWHTADGFPADRQRIERLLQKLSGLKHGLAVATSASALSRFKVDEQAFERHVTLSKGDGVIGDLYLGGGAGVRQSYGRAASQKAVYAVTLGSYELPLEQSDWQDKTLLQVSSSAVTSLSAEGVTLFRGMETDQKDVAWTSRQTPAGKQVDQDAVARALKLLQTLRFSKASGSQAPSGYDLEHAAMVLNIRYPGKQRQYSFFRANNEGDIDLLKVSDRNEYFQMDESTVKQWQEQMKPAAWFVDRPATEPKDQVPTDPPSSPEAGADVQKEQSSRH